MTRFSQTMDRLPTLLAAAALAMSSAGPVASQEVKSTLDTIRERGKLLAGVRFDAPPYGYVDMSGNSIGYGVDVAKAMAEKLGVDVEFVQTTSKTRIPLLQTEKIDAEFGITSMSATRDEVVDFSITYKWDPIAILTHKDMPDEPSAFAPPRVVGTTQGSINTELFKEIVPNADVKLYQEYPDLVVALLQKKIDGVLILSSNAVDFVKKHPELKVTAEYFFDAVGIMMRENDSDWRDFINFTLQEMWADKELQALLEMHFGSTPRWHLWSQYRLQPGIEPGQSRIGDQKYGSQ